MRLESTIQVLHQEIFKTGNDREHIDEEIEHVTVHEQMLRTELKGDESLSYKHRELEGMFSTQKREKISNTMEKQMLRTCKAQTDQHKLQVEKLKKLSISCSELGTQIKAVDGL